jgi:hypothetical protein
LILRWRGKIEKAHHFPLPVPCQALLVFIPSVIDTLLSFQIPHLNQQHLILILQLPDPLAKIKVFLRELRDGVEGKGELGPKVKDGLLWTGVEVVGGAREVAAGSVWGMEGEGR